MQTIKAGGLRGVEGRGVEERPLASPLSLPCTGRNTGLTKSWMRAYCTTAGPDHGICLHMFEYGRTRQLAFPRSLPSTRHTTLLQQQHAYMYTTPHKLMPRGRWQAGCDPRGDDPLSRPVESIDQKVASWQKLESLEMHACWMNELPAELQNCKTCRLLERCQNADDALVLSLCH